mgnify:FL=1
MTEKEKMKCGLLYDAGSDQALAKDRAACKELCHAYNQTPPSDRARREMLMRKILGKVGSSFHIESAFWCDYGYNITIGENFYANHNTVILDCAEVIFGDHVFLGPNCGFYTAGHPLDAERRNAGLEFARPITIGNDVWIGGNTVVLPGVSIGDGTVIGSGSVVTKNIPAGVVAVGNPCRILRPITSEE